MLVITILLFHLLFQDLRGFIIFLALFNDKITVDYHNFENILFAQN